MNYGLKIQLPGFVTAVRFKTGLLQDLPRADWMKLTVSDDWNNFGLELVNNSKIQLKAVKLAVKALSEVTILRIPTLKVPIHSEYNPSSSLRHRATGDMVRIDFADHKGTTPWEAKTPPTLMFDPYLVWGGNRESSSKYKLPEKFLKKIKYDPAKFTITKANYDTFQISNVRLASTERAGKYMSVVMSEFPQKLNRVALSETLQSTFDVPMKIYLIKWKDTKIKIDWDRHDPKTVVVENHVQPLKVEVIPITNKSEMPAFLKDYWIVTPWEDTDVEMEDVETEDVSSD